MANNANKGERQSKLQAEQDRRDSAQAKYDAKMKAEGDIDNGWFSGKNGLFNGNKSTPSTPSKSTPTYGSMSTDKRTQFDRDNPIGGSAVSGAARRTAGKVQSVKTPAPSGGSTKFAKSTPGKSVKGFTDLGIDRNLEKTAEAGIARMDRLAEYNATPRRSPYPDNGAAIVSGPERVKVATRSVTPVVEPTVPTVARTKVISTPVKTAKATPARQVPMPPQRPAGIPPSYPTSNAAMAFGPAREKVSSPFSSVSVKGGNGMGGNAGGGSAARSDSRDTAMSFGPGRTPSRAFDK